MSKPLPRVRFKLAWQTYSVGDEITPNATLRDWLVGHGYVDVVSPVSPEPEARPARLSQKAARQLGLTARG